ncbi:MAG: MFS transporter [Chloroflexi bacterium]|nr:MFS transporter [Chloroflexota bacterium]
MKRTATATSNDGLPPAAPLFAGLLPLFILAHFGHHLLTSLTVPMLPLIRSHFGLDYTRSGVVVSAFALSYGTSHLVTGWLTDRIGARTMMATGIVGVALAGIMVGLSPSYVMLLGALGLMGVLGAAYHPASPPVISASVEPNRRGWALGLHAIGGNAAFFLAPLTAAGIAAAWSWRGAFLGLAAPAAIFGIIFYIMLGRRIKANDAARRVAASHAGAASPPGQMRRLAIFIFMTTFAHAILISSLSFVPLYLVDSFGVSPESAAALLAITYSSGLWASPLGGYLSDRWGRLPIVMGVCFLTVPVIFLLNIAPYGVATIALLLVMGMIMGVRMPVSESYIVSQTPEHRRSTVLGFYFFSNFEGGGVLTPAMGYLIDQFGFSFSFSAAAAFLAVVLVFSALLLWRAGERLPAASR